MSTLKKLAQFAKPTFTYITFANSNNRLRSTMDSIRVSEAPDPGSIPGEATKKVHV